MEFVLDNDVSYERISDVKFLQSGIDIATSFCSILNTYIIMSSGMFIIISDSKTAINDLVKLRILPQYR